MAHPDAGARHSMRSVLRSPATALLAVAAVLGGGATAAANDWFPIFRTEQITPVSLSAVDLVALPDLSGYGDLELTEPDVREVADAAAAGDATGLDVPQVATLPRGVSGEPAFQVGDEVSGTFTFSAERATQTLAATGEALPPPPPGLDGSQVRLVAGPGLAAVWSDASGVPSLVVGRAVAPSASATGASFDTVRDYLLALPGLPDEVAAQLATFGADGSTLPLPVPAEQVSTSSADVDGIPATVLTARDRTVAAVVWVADGVVTVVAGSLGADEVLAVARDLR